jgi:hypothetical protein
VIYIEKVLKPKVQILFLLILFVSFGGVVSMVQAQAAEDTSSVEREGPPPEEEVRRHNIIRTPFQSEIPEDDINRYQIRDYDGSYTFFSRLRSESVEDFMFAEQLAKQRYGAEWEQEINERLTTILEETFKEDSEFMRVLARLAPFLGFGYYERYMVPVVPRMEDPDLVPVNP